MPLYGRSRPRFVGPGYSLAWYILGCSQRFVSRRWRSARIGYSHGWFLQAFSICMQPQLPSTIKNLMSHAGPELTPFDTKNVIQKTQPHSQGTQLTSFDQNAN